MTDRQRFVMRQPRSMSVAEVVAAGKAQGVNVSYQYVWQIRKERGQPPRPKPRRRGSEQKVEAPAAQMEDDFVGLALELGLSQSTDLLRVARARCRAILQ